MELDVIKVRTKYNTSTPIYRLSTSDNKTILLGHTGFGIAISPAQVQDLDTAGYIHLNKQVVALPAIPVIARDRLIVISTSVEETFSTSSSSLVTPDSTYILSQVVSGTISVPSILNMDMSKCMVPVLKDTHGKTYMSTSSHKILYVNDAIEAQATIMQVSLPLPDHLLDLGRRFVRSVMSPDTPDKEDYYIYMKDRFESVF